MSPAPDRRWLHIAAAWRLEVLIGRRFGVSPGTSLVACLRLARQRIDLDAGLADVRAFEPE